MEYDLIAIVGPTAVGKTALAAEVAADLNTEIISADSRQIYRRMNLGTGKDYQDYDVRGRRVPYHLIDIVEPGTKYNLFEYQRDFLAAYKDMRARSLLPVLCGGTGLYVESVLRGYRLLPVPENAALRQRLSGKTLPELEALLKTYKQLHNTTDVDTVKRAVRAIEIEEFYREHPVMGGDFPHLHALVVGLSIGREERRRRISVRLRERLEQGMVDEVRGLLAEGIAAEDLIYYGLEYKYVTLYVMGRLRREEMFRRLEIAIHQFAKRQMTWFRGMERRGIKIHWLDALLPMEEKVVAVEKLLRGETWVG